MKVGLAAILSCAVAASGAQAAGVKIFLTSGTGFIVSREGYILTNKHVVNNCQKIVVSGAVRDQEARLVGRDHTYDLALLRIEGGVSYSAVFRPVDQPVQAGDAVVIVGYPGEAAREGAAVTVEAEVLNPKGPQGEPEWMEVSDVIKQGNSGGPLLDTSGHVAGIVTAKATIYTYQKDYPHEGATRHSGIAISLPVLRGFLDGYGVSYREEPSSGGLSAQRVADTADRFIVNVRCAYRTELR